MQKPFSPSCERNKIPILKVLQSILPDKPLRLFEIGSGTGQHAVYMAPFFPQLRWVMSDMEDKHAGMRRWLEDEAVPNIEGPVVFELGKDSFPEGKFDVVFTANTFHIMAWDKVNNLIKLCGEHLESSSLFIVYGPFNYGGRFTSESNQAFDQKLRAERASMGIRDQELLCDAMAVSGFILQEDIAMPANNRCLIFQKLDSVFALRES